MIRQDGNTPLHRAAMTDNVSGIKLLAECKADVNAPNKVTMEPTNSVAVPIVNSDGPRIARILNYYSLVHARAHRPAVIAESPISYRCGRLVLVPTFSYRRPQGLCMHAHSGQASERREQGAKKRVSKGAWVFEGVQKNILSVRAHLQNGNLPLHRAAECGHRESVRLLVKLGASVDLTNQASMPLAEEKSLGTYGGKASLGLMEAKG